MSEEDRVQALLEGADFQLDTSQWVSGDLTQGDGLPPGPDFFAKTALYPTSLDMTMTNASYPLSYDSDQISSSSSSGVPMDMAFESWLVTPTGAWNPSAVEVEHLPVLPSMQPADFLNQNTMFYDIIANGQSPLLPDHLSESSRTVHMSEVVSDVQGVFPVHFPSPIPPQHSPHFPFTATHTVTEDVLLGESPSLFKDMDEAEEDITKDDDEGADNSGSSYYCSSDSDYAPSPTLPINNTCANIPDTSGRRRKGRTPGALPTPVPNLTKKSRGRKVPVYNGIPLAVRSKDKTKKGMRSYTCMVNGCGKCFVRGEHLKRHVRSIHTDEKPFCCPVKNCDRAFSRRDNLGQHVRIHKD